LNTGIDIKLEYRFNEVSQYLNTGLQTMKPLGGRGKKAPYETIQMRVPVPLKLKLADLISEYREKVLLSDEQPDLDDDSDPDDDDSEPSDLEIIKSQAETIQRYLSEIHFLKHKLEQTNLNTSLGDAKENAKKILKSKKSASQSVAKLLSSIYQTEITTDDFK
jgi:hypothetical protein